MERLVSKIAKASADIGIIEKGQTNAHFGYQFRGIDDVMAAVHPKLTAEGVLVIPEVIDNEYVINGKNTFCRITVKYVFTDGVDKIESIVVGEAVDTSDKSTSKALSVALRTCLLQVLMIPTREIAEEDPDRSSPQRLTDEEIAERDDKRKQELIDTLIPAVKQCSTRGSLSALWNRADRGGVSANLKDLFAAKGEELKNQASEPGAKKPTQQKPDTKQPGKKPEQGEVKKPEPEPKEAKQGA